jgi:protein involved in polysaccharide export with SLBB domain
MTQQFMQLILGGTDDVPAQSSSSSPYKLYHGGDTLRLKTPREPGAEGYIGEICWSITGAGDAAIHICTVSTVFDQDGVITSPAIWRSVLLT